jgi:hypothetical protein
MAGTPNLNCPECGRRVDQFDPDAVRAIPVHPSQVAGEILDGAEQGNGHDRIFHEECWPAAGPRWKRVSRLH